MTDASGVLQRLVLVDLSSLWWTAWMVNAENGVQQARSITLANIKRCCGEGNDLPVICCDSGKSFRKELSPEYKANREKQPAAAYGELAKLRERLTADGYALFESSGFEADDLIATFTKMARDRGHEVRIASADKDLMALIGPGVDCLRTHTWSVVGDREFMEKFRIEPKQFTDWLALKGDSSDNVPGCPRIGDVTASTLLTQFETLDRIYEALDAGKQVSTPANEKSLRENRAAVELSRKLVALRFDVPIRFDDLFAERKVQPLTTSEPLPSDGDPTDEPEAPESSAAPVAPVSVEPTSQPSTETAPSMPGTTAVNALVPVEYERQLEPRSLRAAVWLGQHLYDSRLYQRFPTPEAITAVIIRGREMGLGATTALDVFHVIDGKPVPYAWFIISLAMNCRECDYFELLPDANDKSATWQTKRRNNTRVQTCTYTYEQAVTAKLPREGQRGPNAWLKGPEDMLVKTAGVKLARRVYPAQTLGLYSFEEMSGESE